jgi:hypothetical protein
MLCVIYFSEKKGIFFYQSMFLLVKSLLESVISMIVLLLGVAVLKPRNQTGKTHVENQRKCRH